MDDEANFQVLARGATIYGATFLAMIAIGGLWLGSFGRPAALFAVLDLGVCYLCMLAQLTMPGARWLGLLLTVVSIAIGFWAFLLFALVALFG